jgi:putative peptide zinc metalloprotease protein
MPGTGFADRQWLVQRNGHYIQLTELLYRIAEHANGEETLEQIAARVTDATAWEVTADDVRQLLRTKLIASGLVAAAAGHVESGARASGRGDPPSPLALNLRFRLFGPRALDPVAAGLQVLFAPPILLPLLFLLLVAHAWLYLEHGVAGSVGAALYTPGALLVVLAILLGSGVFHELGHASALRYGGGEVREMGAGFYLVMPALYTDVTDSYRLGRWARVRTDLGGVYFHLVFALGFMALYWLTGHELLLFVVLLIDLEVLRQFFPFVRLDGYWILADLTGIPDFFSQMGPFLRTVLGRPGLEGTRLPSLKPWVKAMFGGYIILLIPILGLVFYLIVAGVPALVALTWDSLGHQAAEFVRFRNRGAYVGMSASATQMLLLMLPVVGTVYFFYCVGRKLTVSVWKWSRPTPIRRLAAAVGTGGVVALLGSLWIPEFPPTGVGQFEIGERFHTSAPISYPQTPPVGGPHTPQWQNCGFYDLPIVAEHAVHSLEHGAVWVTYHPDLPPAQVEVLRRLARRERLVLVSPYAGLPVPVVASAWGRQVRLDSADDHRLGRFVRLFQRGLQAPEREGPCTDGIGVPR